MRALRAAGPPPREGQMLARGLAAGRFDVDPLRHAPRRGRPRRWLYAAAGDGELLAGAAIVDLGAIHLAFAWAQHGSTTATWERRMVRGAWLGTHPQDGATARGRDWSVTIRGDGSLRLDVPTRSGRLTAEIDGGEVTPAVLVTRTTGGGWNATEKAAGYEASGQVALGRVDAQLGPDAGGWRDWTAGRQDRSTSWRWAAGAGVADDGRRVGINTSTGMNAHEAGEDVVWWDSTPYPLQVDHLEPLEEAAGPWRVAGTVNGKQWALEFQPAGHRHADDRLLGLRSIYTQPIGRFKGRLPTPRGATADVTLAGVTEDHRAVW